MQISTRKATVKDIPPLLAIINGFAAKGIMLPRTEFEMAENLRDFTVAVVGSQLAGCAALHVYTPREGEIRSLAVDSVWQGTGVGGVLVKALEQEARELGLEALFAFTYVDKFFGKMGFRIIDRGDLPLKAWKDCLRCPKFQCCDEIAMLKPLVEVYTPLPELERKPDLFVFPSAKRALDSSV